MFLCFATLATLAVAHGFLFDSTTTSVPGVGSHGNSPNTWQTIVLGRLSVLEQLSSTCQINLSTLGGHVDILVRELVKTNSTVNSAGKFIYVSIQLYP
jgi:hypothetical protein